MERVTAESSVDDLRRQRKRVEKWPSGPTRERVLAAPDPRSIGFGNYQPESRVSPSADRSVDGNRAAAIAGLELTGFVRMR
jgi:hypothetical protein